ncbi:MAG: hypothetical protein EOO46_12270 [Flavobacterium sp.]|nr:MAG: hypothetical protein EOO46_12270 [Flavobacterium sp.]
MENQIENLQKKVSTLESEKEELEAENRELEDDNETLVELSESIYRARSNVQMPSVIPQINYSDNQISSSSNSGTVVYKPSSCDYFIIENSRGFIIAEWMGGNDPDLGDQISGELNSYGTKDFYNLTRESSGRIWIDDYMLSKESALSKIQDKCN